MFSLVSPASDQRPICGYRRPLTYRPRMSRAEKTTATNRCRSNDIVLSLSAALVLVSLLVVATYCSLMAEAIKLQPGGEHKYYWSGEQFAITCQNTNNIKNVKFRWIGPNGLYVSEDKSAQVHAESTGPHSYRLMFTNATSKRDDGRYRCTIASADDKTARESSEFTLEIHQSTSFRDTAHHLMLQAKKTGVIDCNVDFDPNVLPTSTVSWMRDGQAIEKFNDSNIKVNEWDPMRKLTQLVLGQSDKRYDGTYTCRAIAETAQLSKISDHHIQVETTYAPIFERSTETIWVERPTSAAAATTQRGTEHLGLPTSRSRQSAASGRHRASQESPIYLNGEQASTTTNSDQQQQQAIRVELNCNCQANPSASIVWSLASSRFVLNKGDPEHILDLTPTHTVGHNASSTLVISYNLDPNWRYKLDSYICTANNKQGSSQKVFTVEQGDPPPAFRVGSQRHYDPLTYQFKFQLLGPNFEGGQAHEIVPPVDALRIRAENANSPSGAAPEHPARPWQMGTNTGAGSQAGSRRRNEPSVQLNLPAAVGQQQIAAATNQSFTVNLSKLPSGPQRLYLETHNAVGWSPNATYLGDYNIVNGAVSSVFGATNSILPQYLQIIALNLAAVLMISLMMK